MREKLKGNDTIQDMIVKMAEGNPGALRVLCEMSQARGVAGFSHLLDLDDMNIRGPQIWVGFKDYCREDLGKFREAIAKRDPKMVTAINIELPEMHARVNRYE